MRPRAEPPCEEGASLGLWKSTTRRRCYFFNTDIIILFSYRGLDPPKEPCHGAGNRSPGSCAESFTCIETSHAFKSSSALYAGAAVVSLHVRSARPWQALPGAFTSHGTGVSKSASFARTCHLCCPPLSLLELLSYLPFHPDWNVFTITCNTCA